MSMSATRRLQWPSERGLLPDNGLMGMLWSAYYAGAGTDMDRWRSNCPPRVRHASVGYLSEQCLFSIPFSPIPNANVDFSASASLDLGIFPLGPYTRVPFLMFGWRRRHMSTILAVRRQRPAWLAPLR